MYFFQERCHGWVEEIGAVCRFAGCLFLRIHVFVALLEIRMEHVATFRIPNRCTAKATCLVTGRSLSSCQINIQNCETGKILECMQGILRWKRCTSLSTCQLTDGRWLRVPHCDFPIKRPTCFGSHLTLPVRRRLIELHIEVKLFIANKNVENNPRK